MKKYYFFVLVLLISIISCSRDEVEPSNLTLLTDNGVKSWLVVKLEVDGVAQPSDCSSDDIFTFELYNEDTEATKYTIEDNLVACVIIDDYIVSEGTWRLNNKGNRITLVQRDNFVIIDENNQQEEASDFVNQVFDIVEISESILVLQATDESNEFDPKVVTYTLREF
ncbi:MAG: hypothetical protein RH860_02205 [Cytophagales bacterium]